MGNEQRKRKEPRTDGRDLWLTLDVYLVTKDIPGDVAPMPSRVRNTGPLVVTSVTYPKSL